MRPPVPKLRVKQLEPSSLFPFIMRYLAGFPLLLCSLAAIAVATKTGTSIDDATALLADIQK